MSVLRLTKSVCISILLLGATAAWAQPSPGTCISIDPGYIPPAAVGNICERGSGAVLDPWRLTDNLREARESRVLEPQPRSREASVSYREITHEVPKAARKAFEKAERAKAAGKKADAIAGYRKAVELDPKYLEAWNNLGSVYSHTEEISAAEQAFQRAYEIEPRALVAANLAFVQLRKGQAALAEPLAREAMRGDPLAPNPRYLLAIALAAQNKQLPEAVQLLEGVCGEIPQAHLTLAPLLSNLERLPEAAGHLKAYLAMGSTADQEIAKKLLLEIETSLGKR